MARRVIRDYITVSALVLVCTGACGSGSPAPSAPSTSSPSPAPAGDPFPQPQPEPTPPGSFGAGRHRVGVAISPGRYFSDPSPGCYWERQSGDGGTASERIGFAFIGFDAAQWIVDIAPGDRAFQTNESCGTWSKQPRTGPFHGLEPGLWLVGTQALPGLYKSSASSGCYWERLRDFAGHSNSVIARDLLASPTPAFVSIAADDTGFSATAECGTWTRVDPVVVPTQKDTAVH